MRDSVAEAGLDDLLGQQAHGPTVMAHGRVAAGERGDLGALYAIDTNRATGAWRILQAGETRGQILVTPRGYCDEGHPEGSSNRAERLATVEFEEGGGALEGAGGQCAFAKQRRELVALSGG